MNISRTLFTILLCALFAALFVTRDFSAGTRADRQQETDKKEEQQTRNSNLDEKNSACSGLYGDTEHNG